MNRQLRYTRFRAEKKNIACLLSDDDIKQLLSSPCHYCGDQVTEPFTMFIDIADPALGMIKSNCRTTCLRCHNVISTINEGQFLGWIDQIVKRQSLR